MKYKIYYQEHNNLKSKIIDITNSSDLPKNIIKMQKVKKLKDYLDFTYISHKDVSNLFKELSIMLNTNLTISNSIDILLDSKNNKYIEEILLTIKSALKNAQPIHKALLKHKKHIGDLPILFFKLAHINGDIKSSINSLSLVLQENEKSKKKFISAITYPIILMVSLITSLGVICSFVLPRFEHIFIQFGDNLPMATKALLIFKDTILNHYVTIFSFLFLFVLGFKYLYEKKKVIFDKLIVLNIPLVSNLYKQFVFYRFFLALSMLLKSNYTFQTALENTKFIVNNQFILFKMNQVINDIRNAVPISKSFENTKLFDNLTIRLLHTAQESNTLPLILEQITQIHHEKLNESIKHFSNAMGPLFIFLIGMVMLWIVFAIMLPIWDLGSVLN